MLRTVLCDLLGIEFPIIQGAMQGAGGPILVSAVSESGGLGVLPTFGTSAAQLREDIVATRERTAKPFAVNITPIGPDFTLSRAQIVIELGVKIVTTGRGDPGTPIVRMLKEAGIIVLPVVPSVAHARRVEAEGADAIIASGCEAGGHVGTVATLPLIPQVVDAVNVPVVAAGGIADARGVLAALALGACGVQIGTRFITTEESEAPAWVKEKVLQARETDTIVTSLLTGKPVRTLATQGIRDYEQALRNGAGEEKLKALRARVRSAEDGERVAVAGQIAGLITSVTTVANLIQELVEGVSEVYTGLRATVSPGQRSAASTPPAGRNALRNG
jgi:enoyl-[acyl-carrier protein] reductase II